jgi:hypothetical protein
MRYFIMHLITALIDSVDLPIDAAEELICVLNETISILESRYCCTELIDDDGYDVPF